MNRYGISDLSLIQIVGFRTLHFDTLYFQPHENALFAHNYRYGRK